MVLVGATSPLTGTPTWIHIGRQAGIRKGFVTVLINRVLIEIHYGRCDETVTVAKAEASHPGRRGIAALPYLPVCEVLATASGERGSAACSLRDVAVNTA
jgi:hypothetical protein